MALKLYVLLFESAKPSALYHLTFTFFPPLMTVCVSVCSDHKVNGDSYARVKNDKNHCAVAVPRDMLLEKNPSL